MVVYARTVQKHTSETKCGRGHVHTHRGRHFLNGIKAENDETADDSAKNRCTQSGFPTKRIK